MKIALLFALLTLTACVAGGTKTPRTAIYAIESDYLIALSVANGYKALPACGIGAPAVCASPQIVQKLKDADNIAGPAILKASATAADPNADLNTINTVTLAAQTALAALTQIEASLPTKK